MNEMQAHERDLLSSNSSGYEESTADLIVVSSFAFCSGLLLLGHVLRVKLWVLRVIFLPSSLIGGVIGLLIVQLAALDADSNTEFRREWIRGWELLPNFLICIVFSCLFLGAKIPGVRKVWLIAGPQLMYGQIVAWGQYAVPMIVTATLIVPAGLANNTMIGAVVALGFEGGHGTAAGLRPTFIELGYAEGADLALFTASVGLVSAVIYGTVVVNWAIRKGLITRTLPKRPGAGSLQQTAGNFNGIYEPGSRPSAGEQTVAVDSLDSLAFHTSVVGMALLFGYGIKRGLLAIQAESEALEEIKFFSAFPLFPFAMFGGICIQITADRWFTPGLINRETMDRISGLALDFTVVTAIATMDIESVKDSIGALMILIGLTWAWHMFCFFVVAPRILPDSWVERSVAEMGQSMGVTSTGLLLLRMVDPENKTPALTAFSYKQLLHEPIVGGGIWTALVLPFIAKVGIWPASIVATSAVVLWFVLYFAYFRGVYRRNAAADALFRQRGEGETDRLLSPTPEP